jgi:poly(A) polymerase
MRVARIERELRLPAEVREILGRLHGEGRAWLVGGTVRDLLLGVEPRDYDVATDLRPEAVLRLLPDSDARDAKLGVCRVPSPNRPIAVTTLRRESGYTDHRRPDTVAFVTEVAIDAERRDFTVNGLYLDVANGQLLDPVGGQRDLDARLLRTIGDPVRRFSEDALRLLRAVRFAARCGLELEPATRTAAIGAAADVARLAPERLFEELTDAFTSAGRGRALRLLVELGQAAAILPEVAAMDGVTQPPEYHPEGDVLTHVSMVLDHVPEGDPVLAWSAVLHDAGKPPTWRQGEDRIRFDGHDVLSAQMAEEVLARLRAPARLRELVADVSRQHIRFAALPMMRPRRRERWLRSPDFPVHLEFHRADCLGSHGKLDIYEMARAELQALPPAAAPLVGGADALALGVPAGPEVGRLLRAVHEAADESPTPLDRRAALELLRELVDRWRQDGGQHAR